MTFKDTKALVKADDKSADEDQSGSFRHAESLELKEVLEDARIELIEPDEVVFAALRLLGEAPPAALSTRHLPLLDAQVRYVDAQGRALGVVARSSVHEPRS